MSESGQKQRIESVHGVSASSLIATEIGAPQKISFIDWRRLSRGRPDDKALFPHILLRYLPAAADCSHSRSFDQRRRPDTLRTAMATAFFWPTRTTSRLPRVTPV